MIEAPKPATKLGFLFPSEHPGPFSPLVVVLLLGLLVVLSYLPALQAGFVWDDDAFTKAEPLRSLSGLWQIWFEPRALKDEGHYWPVLYTTFWLEYQLWGLAPLGYHIVNLLLHWVVTWLLWRLLLRLEVPGAWAVAMIFAVHPLHVESVAWVIGRKDLLAALFSMASALAYLRFTADRQARYYGWALGFLVLGMLSKSVTVTLPLAFLIWHWWQQGRVTRDDLMKVLPLLLVTGYIAFTDWSHYKGIEILSFDYSLIERALIAAHALWFYVGKLLWPVDLAVVYPLWDINVADPLGWGRLLAAVLVAVLLWYFRHRIGRAPLAAALFFVVTLSPVLGFVDYGFMQFSLVADRYQYFAGIGVIATLVGGATYWLGKLSDNLSSKLSGHSPGHPPNNQPASWRLLAPTLVVIPLIILGTLTWQQARIYRNSGTFFEHIIALNPQARRAHFNLGNYLRVAGRNKEALAAYRIALEKQPDYVMSYIGMGLIAENEGQFEQAEQLYQIALQVAPEHAWSIAQLGSLRLKQQRFQEALKLFQSVRNNNPWGANLHVGIGAALQGLSRFDEALQSYERALLLDPSLPVALAYRLKVLKLMEDKS